MACAVAVLGIALAVLVAGCANRTIESAHFGSPSALESTIREHHAEHAIEHYGRCR